MSGKKGAVPKARPGGIFGRSTMLNRTPPKTSHKTPPKTPPHKTLPKTPSQLENFNEQQDVSVYLCQICTVTDGVHKIRCDSCTLWYHFACAKVPSDAADKDYWLCPKCVKDRRSARVQSVVNVETENQSTSASTETLIDIGKENPTVTVAEDNPVNIELENPSGQSTLQLSKSQSDDIANNFTANKEFRKSGSTSSVKSRRTLLALQRLEEERMLNERRDQEARKLQAMRDEEYFRQRYSILEDDVASNLSFDDEEVNRHKYESVRRWAENVEPARSIITEVQVHHPPKNADVGTKEYPPEAGAVGTGDVNVTQNNLETTTSATNQPIELPDWLTNPQSQITNKLSFGLQEHNDDLLRKFAAMQRPTQNQINVVETTAALTTAARPSTSLNNPGVPNTKLHIQNLPDAPIANVASFMNQLPPQSIGTGHLQQVVATPPVNQLNGSGHAYYGQAFGTSQLKPIEVSQSFGQSVYTGQINGHQEVGLVPTQASGQTLDPNQTFSVGTTSHSTSLDINKSSNQQSNTQLTIHPWIGALDSNLVNLELNTAHASVANTMSYVNQSTPQHQPSGSGPLIRTELPVTNQLQSIGTNLPLSQSAYVGRIQPIAPYYTFASNPNQVYVGQTFNTSQTSSMGPSQQQQMGFGQTFTTGQLFYNQSNSHQSHSPGQAYTTSSATIHQQSPMMGNSVYIPSSTNVGVNQNYLNGSIMFPGAVMSAPLPGRLTAEQIASRHAIPKELPYFSGDPRAWQSFISAYENSTNACGYSNSENLGRLQKCLKGDAEVAVKSRLLHADNVPGVIDTLRLMYGRPELIISTMIEDVEKLQSPKDNDLPALIKFAIAIQNLSATIQSLRAVEHLRNPMLINMIIEKLPAQHQLNWAFYKQTVGVADVSHLGNWLYGIADVASQVVRVSSKSVKKPDASDSSHKRKQNSNKSDNFLNTNVENASVNDTKERFSETTSSKKNASESVKKDSKKCPVCHQNSCQRVKDCKKFGGLNVKERWIVVKEKELCFRCLSSHRRKDCKSKQKCNVGGCQKNHHSLLHESEAKTIKNSSESDKGKSEEPKNVNCSHQSVSRKSDIFRIVPVKLYHNGRSVSTFAYLDDGSNVTTIENGLADELDLERSTSENLCVKWSFGKVHRTELESSRVSVRISGVSSSATVYDLNNVRTVTELALPRQTISSEWLKSYKHLDGIPVTTYEDAKPRMLIGLQYSKLMVSLKTVEGSSSEPIACKTRLGWVIQGPDGGDGRQTGDNYSFNICECHHEDGKDLHEMVKEFFAWDSYDTKAPVQLLESKEIQRARKILDSTTRKINGRYETGLLWRYDDVEFPNSYPMALKRLECLERKMEKDPVLAQKMCDYIQDFVEKGYVRKLTPRELLLQPESKVFYLPIFPVFNPKKPQKFRVVWDAAAMVNKISLNAMLLAGPDLLKPLPDVLRRFRERLIAILGDMKEFFHQIRVISTDVHVQRFLWRDGNSQVEPEIFVIEVLTFGAKNSPCSAQYAKNTNALEHKEQFPRAVEAIIDNHYQDDMLESFDSVQEAVRVTNEVKWIHANGGFEMRNFMSNSGEVLLQLGEKAESHVLNLDISTEPTIERVLGMFWNSAKDTFTFSLKFAKIPEEVLRGLRIPTKREVLSALMSIFDPLGLIAHYLVHGKILLRKIWRDDTKWDEQISELAYKQWLTWLERLPEIEKIEIPRWYSTKLESTNQKRIQLHIFVDAGLEACATGAYYRIEDEEGVDCCLIGAKTKVAPTKPLSVPRLELQAAVLGVRLADNINKSQRIRVDEKFFWSDSQTVLGWIHSEARKFHQYVAFRIGEVLESSSVSEWNWVNSENNVADDATKSENQPDPSSTSRWYKAPPFLYQPRATWTFGKDKSKFSTEEEMRAVYLLAHIEMPNYELINVTNFSNWSRLVRAMAYALRFIDNLRKPKRNRQVGPFTREEYIRSRNTLFRQAQRDEFLDEILIIRNNETLPVDKQKELHKSSVLRSCSPYLDQDGILRIKGRIDAAKSVPYNTKRPIILPRNNCITKLLVLWHHQTLHHVNHQATLNQIKQTFYVPALRVVLRGIIQNLCQRCKNDRAKPIVPEMAELPPERLSTFTRPFTFVGVDYFGPLKVKVRRSAEKRWGVIFTCLTTRAVHIEIAHSLDTSSCVFCIRNFSNRMGQPSKYFSDHGTHFTGAERELREEFLKMNKAKIEETFTDEHTQWSFNPPTAAHMGGIWERPIRTIKSVLRKVMPTRLPTDEMLRSYLIEIENIVNSIPLTYVALNNVDDDVLTPNHFLKGSANGMKSPGRFDPKNLCRDNWKAVQEMTNQFWRQFVVEYIPTLTRRTKWFTKVKPLRVGDMVIDCDESSERNEWRKGIIEEVAVGKGNQVRRAKVRMIRGEKSKIAELDVKCIGHQSLWRPVAKLAKLDVHGEMLSSSPEAVNREGNVVNASSVKTTRH